MRSDVNWYVTVDCQQIANGNIANQIHGFTIDYGKFILIIITKNLDEENTDEGYSSNNVISHQWKTTIHSANDK